MHIHAHTPTHTPQPIYSSYYLWCFLRQNVYLGAPAVEECVYVRVHVCNNRCVLCQHAAPPAIHVIHLKLPLHCSGSVSSSQPPQSAFLHLLPPILWMTHIQPLHLFLQRLHLLHALPPISDSSRSDISHPTPFLPTSLHHQPVPYACQQLQRQCALLMSNCQRSLSPLPFLPSFPSLWPC